MNDPLAILHVDMDAFYASVEQRDRPELRGKPVIVGGSADQRGVVSAASYEARTFGVHSAMPMVTARRLCPHGIFVPVRMSHYAEIARQIRDVFFSYTPLVQPLSLDEAFLDVHGCERMHGSAVEIGHAIKQRILDEVRLVASVGVAPNKFLAKLAGDLEKPNGFVIIEPERVRAVLDPLPISRLPGVGRKGQERLHRLGIRTIGQLAKLPPDFLQSHFGKSGEHLWNLAQGFDDRAVVPDAQAKHLSSETTFPRDVGDRDALRRWLLTLVEQVGERLRRKQLRAKTVDLKVRDASFQTFTRSRTLRDHTDVTQVIWETAAKLFDERVPNTWLPVRLLGIGVSGLVCEGESQGDLFEEQSRDKQRALDKTLDEIRQRFGREAVRRAGALPPKSGAEE